VQRDLQLKEYANFFKGAPYSQSRYAASHLLELSRWHLLEYLDFIGSAECCHDALAAFARGALLKKIHMSVLCHGNTDAEQAAELIESSARILGSKPLNLSQLPTPRLLRLPDNVEVIYRIHPSLFEPHHAALMNTEERNSAIELTLQADLEKRPDSMLVELLAQMLALPAYERLRTTEQLGYIVNLGMRNDLGVAGLRVIVQSASHHPAQLDERIEAFLAGVPQLLADMSDDAFANHKSALLTAKLEKPKTLRHEAAIYWGEIAQATYDFRRDAADAECIRGLTQQDTIAYWEKMFDAKAPGRRKLSAQNFAAHHTPLPPRLEAGVGGRAVRYVDGLTEALEFKRTLAAFPAPPRLDSAAAR